MWRGACTTCTRLCRPCATAVRCYDDDDYYYYCCCCTCACAHLRTHNADLKSPNVLLCNDVAAGRIVAKVSDFGLSRATTGQLLCKVRKRVVVVGGGSGVQQVV